MSAFARASLCMLLALFSLSRARADDGDIELARKLFQEGTELARGGAWEEASHRFADSASLKPHAVTKYNLAYCERAQGHLARARELFLESIAEHTTRGGTELQPEMLEFAHAY
ncbi:MAG TPA: hypothetical protein VJR89_40310, partial [Polyangiales bacterium]|nr:hypothetical protein [Polyangiales bacterium]